MHRLINIIDRAIGTEAGMLQPGSSIDLELTPEQLKRWEECGYAEISCMDRPEGSEQAPRVEEPGTQRRGKRNAKAGDALVGPGGALAGTHEP